MEKGKWRDGKSSSGLRSNVLQNVRTSRISGNEKDGRIGVLQNGLIAGFQMAHTGVSHLAYNAVAKKATSPPHGRVELSESSEAS